MNVAQAMQRHQEAKGRREGRMIEGARHPFMRVQDKVDAEKRAALKNRIKGV